MQQWRFEGHFELDRPLGELATVFDMCGFLAQTRCEGERQLLRAAGDGLRLEAVPAEASGYALSGVIDAETGEDSEKLLTGLALALEADGVDFRIELYDAEARHLRSFAPIG